MKKSPKPANDAAKALCLRAGNAHVAVSCDTRPKTVRSAKAYTRKGRRRQAGL